MEDKEIILEQSMAELAKTLATVNDRELLRDFLKALLTPQEYNAVAARWALVRLLDQGMTQRKIAETLGLSLCKITRGSREMKKEESSFRKMIDICKSL
ncbi:MAG: transcriptional regulator [Spirochaetia bacterium]|nr:transcriptional regulator [Spirochaetia bacterium]MBQ3648171.1 transcriptional regulator [Spirochaetia bacterium]MBQ3713127.1 transcriptional regulator [Spirochaetia bacterium]MBQ6673836.1 transcriptional regulator [Spirochaetia bacterium]MBQ6904591.1 transcriptional regulator [Spirochaetia bacterium]